VNHQSVIPYIHCLCMRALLNFVSSRIDLVRGGYDHRSITNGISIVPYKKWSGPPFIAHRGEGLDVYSLIVVGLYYKRSSHLTESPGSSCDMGSCRYAVACGVGSWQTCLSMVISLIHCSEGHVLEWSLLSELILNQPFCP
jgi:hypothetical protein